MNVKLKVMSDSVELKDGQYGFLCMAKDKDGIRRYYLNFKSKEKAQEVFDELEKWRWGWENIFNKSLHS